MFRQAELFEQPKQAKQTYRESNNRYQRARREDVRCIGRIPQPADPARAVKALADLKAFRETYHAPKFYLPDSDDHRRLDDALIQAICSDGQDDPRAFALPRGTGKTTRALVACQWALLSNRKRFPFLIAANTRKSSALMRDLIDDFLHNDLLAVDFPHISYPLRALDGQKKRRHGQTYITTDGRTEHTWIDYDDNHFILPMIEGHECSQACIAAAGILSKGIRGTHYQHKPTGQTRRPDLVILDDVQNDENALSPVQCAKLMRVIEGAVKFMAGPSRPCAVFMACTVIYENDVADQYTDPNKKPRWRGIRTAMLPQLPANMDDWQRYFELRQSLYQGELEPDQINQQLNAYYLAHRDTLELGAQASWPDNYHSGEVCAIQHAMHLYHDDPESFAAECQNTPRPVSSAAIRPLEPDAICAKTLPAIQRGQATPTSQWVVSFIDLHAEVFYWLTLAIEANYSGVIVDYGQFPDGGLVPKATASKARGLSRLYYRDHPGAERGEQAPFEPRIYYGLKQLTKQLLARRYPAGPRQLEHSRIGIDIRWGEATSVCKQFLRETAGSQILGCFGQFVGASSKPFADYNRTKGWLFESDMHPANPESKWILRHDNTGLQYLLCDANQLKSFATHRLNAPAGAPGSIALFDAQPAEHRLLAEHLALSEYAEPVLSRGRTVDQWQLRPSKPDNDWLDCLAGCMALASLCGANLEQHQQPKRRRSLAELRAWKRSNRV